MASHIFLVGEIVNLRPIVSRNVPGGAYEVTKQLPHNGREFEYRIKSASEEHEHVVGESDLTRPWGPARAPLWNPGVARFRELSRRVCRSCRSGGWVLVAILV